MRTTFINTLYEIAKKDKRVMFVAADLGYSVVERFMQDLPSQYLNIGISEQNMAGVAAGMATEGKIPVIYSIVPFATMRNFEQIRNDICYQNLNVKIVGVGAGFSYGPYAHTHHGLEDIGALRTLANLVILCPGDPIEVGLATREAFSHVGPVYLRLGKAGEPNIHKNKPRFKIGKGIVLQEGKDVTVFGTSNLLQRAQEVTDKLRDRAISVRFVSMHTIKPIDVDIIIDSARKTRAIFTIEEHSIIGGLGSAVSEVIAESGIRTKFKRIGVPDRFTKVIGLQEYMRKANGLGVEQIINTILKTLNF
ncbi:MAG: hypothetical protein M1444_02845 [Patescibacteria group bacterium]|nr:hypothetical protein [Patescibacteria group bacterium]MCL6096589.1 hypothetical protein [Patescibacteria group bacterium]